MSGYEEHIYNDLLESCSGNYDELYKLLKALMNQCEVDIDYLSAHEEEEQ